MKVLFVVCGFLIFNKLFLFWLWLWQMKEYHWLRFSVHFETQAVKKILSSFWRPKVPKLTIKTLAIIFYTLLFEFVIFVRLSYLFLLCLIIFAPVISSLLVLLFQGPTKAWQNRLLKKAKEKREKFKDLIVIGITGSYGKTSTKEFLATILSEKFNVLKTAKNINSEVGIAQTILKNLKPEHQIFIAEIGAYERGKIKQVCAMLQPKIGILTGINEQHMSTFGSQENIIKAKYELIELLPKDGLAIFNGNNKYCKNLYQKTTIAKKLVKIPHPLHNTFSTIVRKLLSWDVENFLMTKVTAEELGMTSEEINRACRKIKSPLQIKKGINELKIIDSSYSANPAGVMAHLDYLAAQQGQKILVMPCLIELGKSAKKIHRRIGEKIAQVCNLAIITTKDYFEEIKRATITNGMAAENILLIEEPQQILEKIKNFTQTGDIILLEGRVPNKLTYFLRS